MRFLHCSIYPPYGEIKKCGILAWYQYNGRNPMTLQKMPQLLCAKLEDRKNFTSQALRRSRAVRTWFMRHLFIFLLGIIFRPATFYLPFGGYLPYFRIFVPRLFVLHLFANGFVFPLSISHDSIVHQFFSFFFSLVPKQKII